MVKTVVIVWVVLGAAIAGTAAVMPSVEIDGGVVSVLGIAVVFGLVNALLGPLLRVISLPLTMMTLGLFSLVVNAALLGITAYLLDSLDVGGFFPTVLAAILISTLTAVLWFVIGRLFNESHLADHSLV